MRSVESQATPLMRSRLLLISLLLISGASWTATFSVTRSDDPIPGACQMMDCSLREAVLAANALPGTDTIVLQAVTYNLGQAGTDDFAMVGDLDITEALTVVGVPGFGSPPPMPLTTIDANGIDRVFEVLSGALLTLQAVNVTGGGNVSEGGGIRVFGCCSGGQNSRLVLQNSHVHGNTSTSLGGGIESPDGSTILIEQNSSVRDNNAFLGGGIRKTFGQVVVKDSRVGNNTVSNGGLGAGILLLSSSFTATGAVIDLNDGADEGGGIYASNSDLSLIGSTVRNNSADSGGGLYLASGVDAEISNSVVHDNSAVNDGGGAYVAGDIDLTNSTFSGNSATNGGAVFLTVFGGMTTEHATFRNNTGAGTVLFVEDGFTRITAVTWLNSILSGGCVLNGASVTSLGGNLESTFDTCGLGAGTNDQVSVVVFDLLLFSTLSDNGGPTLTHAIGDSSVARDNAVCDGPCISIDQRFFNRGGAPVDSGAFENGPIFSDSFESL